MSQKSEVLISLACKNLPVGHFEYYYATLRVATGGYFHDKDALSTERVEESSNIEFRERLQLDYVFEEKQIIRAELYGLINGDSTSVSICECSVGRVIHSGGELLKINQWEWKNRKEEIEFLFVVAEDPASKDNLEIKMQGYGLDKKDLFGKSDPYIVVYRRNDRGKLIRTYRSEVVKNTLNPDWKPIVASLQKLCNNELDCELVFRCFDWDGANGDPEDLDTEFDELIGEFNTTTRSLLSTHGDDKKFELINPRKKRKKKNYQHSGLITLKTVQSVTSLSFLDYMFGGTDLNFIVAIDLTSSNGTVDQSTSFHYMDKSNNNEYSVAIQAVLEILQEYDNDELFPAFGFGARVPPDYKISHEYPLNGDYSNPFCKGVSGVLNAYKESLRKVILAGPTYFAPVIRQVTNLARNHKDGSHYFILLILTDGTVDDWVETKRAVIETSYLPISVIVIGIGGGRFSDMETLDQDFKLLRVGNEEACRDNVQFVQMRRFLRAAADGSSSIRWNKISLAKEVLAELPAQVIEYMGRHKRDPGPRRSQNMRLAQMRDMMSSGTMRQASTCGSSSGGSVGTTLQFLNTDPLLITGSHDSLPVTISGSSSGAGRLRRCATSSYEEYNYQSSQLQAPSPLSSASLQPSSLSPNSLENCSSEYNNQIRRLSNCPPLKGSQSGPTTTITSTTSLTPTCNVSGGFIIRRSPSPQPRSSPSSPKMSNNKRRTTNRQIFPNVRNSRN